MNIHEYQAKELLRAMGVELPQGGVAFTVDEAMKVAKKMESKGPWAVKAQIHAGGRGKGGGIKLANPMSADALRHFAAKMKSAISGSGSAPAPQQSSHPNAPGSSYGYTSPPRVDDDIPF